MYTIKFNLVKFEINFPRLHESIKNEGANVEFEIEGVVIWTSEQIVTEPPNLIITLIGQSKNDFEAGVLSYYLSQTVAYIPRESKNLCISFSHVLTFDYDVLNELGITDLSLVLSSSYEENDDGYISFNPSVTFFETTIPRESIKHLGGNSDEANSNK